ncbi:hypothetical protein COLO4_38302 [Corchorus olitorius]|uniref:Uncharacterized protein n=1 Tax=Corchorus olitorius TaxID=93759 RepID=A0A1R3FVP2_9ROSI|nr:hypothetical protein COLO4_38302 [Corchorus olitorius]
MQPKSQVLGRYTAWDLNLDANETVRSEDNIDGFLRNRQYCNGTLPVSSELNIFPYKDRLKQTMLKHEAEFRDQIQELHRLYRRQKELIYEMESYKHHLSLETLQPNYVLSATSSNYVQMPQHPSTPIKSPFSEAKDSTLPLHSYDKNRGQTVHNPSRIQCSSTVPELLETNCKRFGKKILDLELPAEEYIDSEEEEFSAVKMAPEVTDIPTNVLKKIPETRDWGDKELFISCSGCNTVLHEGNSIPGFIFSKPRVLADLNIPAKLEEDYIPELIDFEDPVIGQRETSLKDPSGKSNSNDQVLSKEVISNSQIMRDPETQLDVLPLDNHNSQTPYVTCNDKAGSVARNVSANSYKLVATSDMFSSYQIVPLAEGMNSGTSSVSSKRRESRRSPIAVQALPCFKGKSSKSFAGSPGISGNEFSLSKSLLSSPKLGSAIFPQASQKYDCQHEVQPPTRSSISLNCNNENDSSFEQHTPAECTKDFKYAMSVNSLDLNSALPSFSTIVAGSEDSSLIHGEKTPESSTGCSPQTAGIPVYDGKFDESRDQSIPMEFVLKQANTECVHDAELEKVETSNSHDYKRILGFDMKNTLPIPNGQCSSHPSPTRNHQNSCAKEDIKDKEKDRIPDINLECDHVLDSEKQLAAAELVAESEPCETYPGYRVLIDLNSCSSLDESLGMPSDSIEIDLQPPASPENKESSPPRGESDENQLEMPLLSSGQEDGDLQEELVKIAAEAIVSISSSEIQTSLESIRCEPFRASWNNSLYWFARVASSVVDNPGSEYGINIGVRDCSDDEEYLSDGIDYFEAMTLNLKEIKVDESWCKKDEEHSANFLRNQPRRGRTRGRQQRKDFQSEILPSLASLSRYEVTEDLQMIGGLMEAAGARWESGSSRNAGRNGCAKGRRRCNAHASNIMASTTNTLLKGQSIVQEGGIRERRLVEWGKITRRPRGPRCPSSNPRLILGQV